MGLAPKYFEKILGKRISKKVGKGKAISLEDFD